MLALGQVLIEHKKSLAIGGNPDEFVKDASRYKTYVRDYEIRDVIVDRQGRLWLSASGDGLVQVEPGDGETEPKFHVFNTSNGLVNNLVQSVVDTPDGNLWISTQQGVTAWNARKKSFENYMFSRNPMGNVYNENSAVCLDDGRVVLGGNYGLTIIQPSRLSHVSGLTDVVFTSYPYSDEITLTYEQRSPNIHFSTLDYSDVRNVKYTYRLEGFDQSWSQPSSTPWAAYQKLPAGKYLLHVKACTSDGTWGKESTLVIRIKPPFYLTSWAIMIYVLLVLGVIILVVKFVHDKKDRDDMPRSVINNVKMKNIKVKSTKQFYTMISSENYDLGSFSFENIDVTDPVGIMDTSVLGSCKLNKVKLNGKAIK
jgi:hypothetical protein